MVYGCFWHKALANIMWATATLRKENAPWFASGIICNWVHCFVALWTRMLWFGMPHSPQSKPWDSLKMQAIQGPVILSRSCGPVLRTCEAKLLDAGCDFRPHEYSTMVCLAVNSCNVPFIKPKVLAHWPRLWFRWSMVITQAREECLFSRVSGTPQLVHDCTVTQGKGKLFFLVFFQ